MDHSIRISLTEKQRYVLDSIAKSEYRTVENLFAKYAAVGLECELFETDIFVKKREQDEDYDTLGPKYQNYNDKELIDIFDQIPFEN